MLSPELQHRIIKAVTERDRQITVFLNRYQAVEELPDKFREITEIDDAQELARRIAARNYTALEVLEAYCHRAAISQKSTNSLTCVAFDSALSRAAELDQHLTTDGKTLGPLHGVPISLKDAYDVVDMDSSIGYVSWLGQPKKRNAISVDALLAAGAVIYCKTNCPQAMKWGETDNFIFGRSTNPFNADFSPGGSSGGEGALIASKGSILGMGTDMGGSVRMPASACGLFSLRPTSRRLANQGVTNCLDGLGSLESTIGPIARSIGGLKLAFQTIVNASQVDAIVVPIPWREEAFQTRRSFVFGLQPSDGVILPHPPIVRALNIVKDRLIAAGHRVIIIPAHKHAEITQEFDGFMQLDRGSDHAAATGTTGEPIFPGNLSEFEPNHNQLSGTDIMRMNSTRDRLRQEYKDFLAAFKDDSGSPLDFIIGPVMAHTAIRHGTMKYYGYTKVWNFLDYPCGTVPVTHVDALMDDRPVTGVLSENDRANAQEFDAKRFAGLPAGVQVIGQRFREEELLAGMRTVYEALTFQ